MAATVTPGNFLRILLLVAGLAFPLLCASAADADPVLKYNDQTSLFDVESDTATAITANAVFWRGNWTWAGLDILAKPTGDLAYTFSGSGSDGFAMSGDVSKSSPRSVSWMLRFSKGSASDLFGGISFKIAQSSAVSEILPGNAGLRITLSPGQQPISVAFDPAPADIHFERGDPHEVRAFIFNKDSSADVPLKMTVTLPEGGTVRDSDEARVKRRDATWYPSYLAWNAAPIDLSFLNAEERPAGRRGFVKADGDKLVFEDGTKARFWGTNITASALFHTPENMVRVQAKRLAKLGFNLVRLHHHDSDWVGFNVFGRSQDYTGKINETALARLDWWIKCLKDEGIYVWLDLHVGRMFSKSEGIRGFDEMSEGKPRAKASGFTYLSSDIQDRMKEFNAAYLGHVNRYTNVAYGQEPAVVGTLITNENDLTSHYGNSFLPDKGVPYFSQIYMAAAASFAKKSGLDENAVWQSWLPGPPKLFLNDLEHTFNSAMIAHLRGLGAKAPIATTNSWGGMHLSSLPALLDGDVIDVHSYARPNEIARNPRTTSGFADWFTAAAMVDKPLTVSEWNVEPFPAFDRATSSPYLAAIASLQDWSGLMQFAYAQADLIGAGGPENYTAANDPSFIATLPAAALLFRQEHVAVARKSYVLNLSPEQLVNSDLSPQSSRAIRTLTETSKLRVSVPAISQLPWLKPSKHTDAIEITDPNFDAIPAGQSYVCSDTAQICRNWETGVMTIDTPRSQMATGWIGGHNIPLSSMTADVDTPYATLILQSLDNQAIGQSGHLLVTLTAQAVPSPGQRLPFLMQPITGSASIKAKAGLKTFSVLPDGTRVPKTSEYIDGSYKLRFAEPLQTPWIILE